VTDRNFMEIEADIRELGKPYIGGTVLRETACKQMLVCATCGQLEWEGMEWSSDWMYLCQRAIRHIRENPGHRVAIDSWNGAIYSSETEDEDAGLREESDEDHSQQDGTPRQAPGEQG
jgi:hypothetical protein